MDKGLPDSNQLATMLLEAAETAANLQAKYFVAWSVARIAKLNRDLLHDEVVAAAYANGGIDGKNAETRGAQLDAIVGSNLRLASYEESLRSAEGEAKRVEGLLEAARVYRASLHDLVVLRCAELGLEAVMVSRQKIGAKRKEKAIE